MQTTKSDFESIRKLAAQWEATGRVVVLHPRKGTVSLNGMRAISARDAKAKMIACLYPQT